MAASATMAPTATPTMSPILGFELLLASSSLTMLSESVRPSPPAPLPLPLPLPPLPPLLLPPLPDPLPPVPDVGLGVLPPVGRDCDTDAVTPRAVTLAFAALQ